MEHPTWPRKHPKGVLLSSADDEWKVSVNGKVYWVMLFWSELE